MKMSKTWCLACVGRDRIELDRIRSNQIKSVGIDWVLKLFQNIEKFQDSRKYWNL